MRPWRPRRAPVGHTRAAICSADGVRVLNPPIVTINGAEGEKQMENINEHHHRVSHIHGVNSFMNRTRELFTTNLVAISITPPNQCPREPSRPLPSVIDTKTDQSTQSMTDLHRGVRSVRTQAHPQQDPAQGHPSTAGLLHLGDRIQWTSCFIFYKGRFDI